MSKITDDEKAIFRNAMHRVKPLHPTKESNRVIEALPKILKKSEAKKRQLILDENRNHNATHRYTFSPQKEVTGSDALSFCGHGLQHKKFTQLKQGKLRIEATLDLHEHTRDAAIIATDDFLKRCQHNGFRVVCIIHGKGLYSAGDQPVLKNLLNGYLRAHPAVLAFHSAQNRDGGTGALYLLIKSTSQ